MSLEEIFEEYLWLIRYIVLARVNPADADDVIQTIVFKICKNYKTIRNEESIGGWVRMIVKHTIASFYREKKRNIKQHEAYLSMSSYASWNDYDILYRMECNVTVNDILAHLPDKFRNVLVLRYLKELEVREIALVLNESPAVISNWISYAKKLIKNRTSRKEKIQENMFASDMVG